MDIFIDGLAEVDNLHTDIGWIGELILQVEIELPRDRQNTELRNTVSREATAYCGVTDAEYDPGHIVCVLEVIRKSTVWVFSGYLCNVVLKALCHSGGHVLRHDSAQMSGFPNGNTTSTTVVVVADKIPAAPNDSGVACVCQFDFNELID
ncbi:hypothetical protein P1J78_23685 [Psychromarinibacter sp. C21-152]|uniref:Uncharacterized protein n=1 Tax=Psychromarinibacter sediminicola TaxID=3033385 RepID=A0AAE3TBD3_9RHOB|nr:hypothetical protein [Psychromarinibacter sediminicola]MDF0603728.1 hypothetical protein [Psychromarinibacter sediminicola]